MQPDYRTYWISKPTAQHGLYLTPLARPQTWCFLQRCRVPSLISLHIPASGAGEAPRWAALSPKYGCRTDPVARHHRASSGVIRHRPGIVRASSGHIRVRNDHRVPYRLSPVTSSRRARRVRYDLSPDRVPSGVSRAVSPVAGHDMRDGRRVPYDPSPDRVTYDPSPDRVSSYFCPCRRPRSLCRGHGRVSRTPVVGHVPAQQPPVADAATGGLRTCILLHGRGVQLWRVRRRG